MHGGQKGWGARESKNRKSKPRAMREGRRTWGEPAAVVGRDRKRKKQEVSWARLLGKKKP